MFVYIPSEWAKESIFVSKYLTRIKNYDHDPMTTGAMVTDFSLPPRLTAAPHTMQKDFDAKSYGNYPEKILPDFT